MESITKISKMVLLAAFLVAALGTSVLLYKSAMSPGTSTVLLIKN